MLLKKDSPENIIIQKSLQKSSLKKSPNQDIEAELIRVGTNFTLGKQKYSDVTQMSKEVDDFEPVPLLESIGREPLRPESNKYAKPPSS